MRPRGEVASTAGAAFLPLADLEESDDAFTVEVKLPGVDKDDVNIEVSGRRVTVSGERKERERKGVLRPRHPQLGRFFHEAVLPGDVNEDDVTATLNDGVLTVPLPKAETARHRRVEITR